MPVFFYTCTIIVKLCMRMYFCTHDTCTHTPTYLCIHTHTHTAVATQHFLQGWNIALIVIGALAFVIGDAVGAGLGTWLAVKSDTNTGKCTYIHIFC